MVASVSGSVGPAGTPTALWTLRNGSKRSKWPVPLLPHGLHRHPCNTQKGMNLVRAGKGLRGVTPRRLC